MSDQPSSPTDVGNPWATPSVAEPSHEAPPPPPEGYLGQPSDPVLSPPPPHTQYVSASAPTQRQWPYASWIVRVAASLIDGLVLMVGGIPYVVGLVLIAGVAGSSTTYDGTNIYASQGTGDAGTAALGALLMLAGALLMLGIWFWNRVFRMGRTGQSVGKRAMRLYLVAEQTGNPMGAGLCFVRELAHYLDAILYIGYLWPLWDVKRQTFADKVMTTVVAQAPSTTY